MAEPQLVSGRMLVTLDEGEQNIGKIVQHTCQGEARLMIAPERQEVPPGEEPSPIAEIEYYDHIVFVKEMSDEVDIDSVTYLAMSVDAILAVIPED